jgi:hypothetical protein
VSQWYSLACVTVQSPALGNKIVPTDQFLVPKKQKDCTFFFNLFRLPLPFFWIILNEFYISSGNTQIKNLPKVIYLFLKCSIVTLLKNNLRDWICKQEIVRLFIKITCGNQPNKPTHHLSNQPGMPACYRSAMKEVILLPGKTEVPVTTTANTGRLWLVTDGLPNFCLYLPLRTNQIKSRMFPTDH